MNKVLIVVDMQNDFINGSLGTAEAQAIVPKVVEKIKSFTGKIYATQDTHYHNYLDTQEGKYLPVAHCILGLEGHKIEQSVDEKLLAQNAVFFKKETFGSQTLAAALQDEHRNKTPIDSIELCGLCTDICVVSNALLLKAFLPEVSIVVDSSCCAGVTPNKHEAALEVMRSCHIDVI